MQFIGFSGEVCICYKAPRKSVPNIAVTKAEICTLIHRQCDICRQETCSRPCDPSKAGKSNVVRVLRDI